MGRGRVGRRGRVGAMSVCGRAGACVCGSRRRVDGGLPHTRRLTAAHCAHRFTAESDWVVVGETTEESETSWFGALALEMRAPRQAAAVATEPTKLLLVDRAK
eukprot:3628539-Prymnesium_polylepis.1